MTQYREPIGEVLARLPDGAAEKGLEEVLDYWEHLQGAADLIDFDVMVQELVETVQESSKATAEWRIWVKTGKNDSPVESNVGNNAQPPPDTLKLTKEAVRDLIKGGVAKKRIALARVLARMASIET